VPPTTVPIADPLFPPKQETFVLEEIDAVGPLRLLTVTPPVTVHPLPSVTVTEYPPAAKPVAVAADPPDGDQK
jgi:hypothetical protein